jgi:hypothetical protein
LSLTIPAQVQNHSQLHFQSLTYPILFTLRTSYHHSHVSTLRMSSLRGIAEIGHYLSGIENLDDYYELARNLMRMYFVLRNLGAEPVFEDYGVRRKTSRFLSPRYWAWLAKYPSARLHFTADIRLIRPCLERAERYVQDLVME